MTRRGAPPAVTVRPFGTLPDGRRVHRYDLANAAGLRVGFLDYGATLVSVLAPDREGTFADVILGFDRLEDYVACTAYPGGLIGRCANRIAQAKFTLDGVEHRLTANEPPNHLHGGRVGFDRALWTVAPFERAGAAGAVLTHVSPAGEEGYPGELRVRATRTLTDDSELVCELEAMTDAPTHVNLTQHPYFRLGADEARDVLGHELTVRAARYTPVDDGGIPTGELRRVAGTPFDFRRPAVIGSRIAAEDAQLARAGGYDHNFVLDPPPAGTVPRFAARLFDPASGRAVDVLTTEPGLQVYTGNALEGIAGRGGSRWARHAGVALETQHFPDSPNRPSYPPTRLDPGQVYRSRTVYRFLVAPLSEPAA